MPAEDPLNWKPIIFAVKVLISVAILGYLFYGAAQEGHWAELRDGPKHWLWLAGAFAICLLSILVSFYRWQLLIQAVDLPLKLFDSIRISFVGLFFGLIAFGPVGGDSLRAFYAARRSKNKVPIAVTSVIADRVIGLLTMFSVAALAFLFFDPDRITTQPAENTKALNWLGRVVVLITASGYLGMAVLFFTPWFKNFAIYQRLIRVPKIGSIVQQLVAAIQLYRDRPLVISVAFLLSLITNVGFTVAIYCIAVGLGVDNPGLANHFLIEPVAMVSNAVPLPGGVGGMEFAMKLLYLAFDSGHGVVVGFALRIALLLLSAVGGGFWFLDRDAVARIEQDATQ